MAGKNYLIFDYGASNGRSVVASYSGCTFNMEVTHRFDNQPVSASGTLYWDILKLYQELKNGLALSSRKYKNITSIAIDSWGIDFGMLDINGKLISNPVHYRDSQRAQDSEKLNKIVSPEKLFELTGAWILPLFDLYHLFSLKINGDSQYLYGKKLLPIADMFNYFLTGNTFNEFSRITTSIFYNQKDRKLEDYLLKTLDFPQEIFCPLIYPGDTVGLLSKSIKEEFSIGAIKVIAPATHDTASAVAGIPVVSTEDDWAFISMGTWCIIGTETATPLISGKIFKELFSNEAGVEDTNIFVKTINGLWTIQQCRQKWIKDADSDISWDDIVAKAKQAAPLKCLIDVEKPQFAQLQSDMPNVIIDFCKDTSQPLPEGIGEVARCIYESLAIKFKYYLNLLEEFSSKKIKLLHLVGGGTKNKLLCQFIANSTGMPVISGPIESTSVGCLLMQLKADGEINSLKEGRKISLDSSKVLPYKSEDAAKWEEAYQRYLKVV